MLCVAVQIAMNGGIYGFQFGLVLSSVVVRVALITIHQFLFLQIWSPIFAWQMSTYLDPSRSASASVFVLYK